MNLLWTIIPKGKTAYQGQGNGAVEYTMDRFIDRVLSSTEADPAPYFRNQVLYELFPTLKDDIQPLPEYFQPNWLPDHYGQICERSFEPRGGFRACISAEKAAPFRCCIMTEPELTRS